MKNKKLTLTSLILVASLVGCTEGHKISKDEASKIITDILNVVSDPDFSLDVDELSVHYTEKIKTTNDENGLVIKTSDVTESFFEIDKSNNLFSVKTIASSEDIITSSEGEEYKSKETSMKQDWIFEKDGIYYVAEEIISSTSSVRNYVEVLPAVFDEFFANALAKVNDFRFDLSIFENLFNFINDTENYSFIKLGFSNKSTFKSNKTDGNIHIEYEGKLSTEEETSKVNWQYQIDDYFIIDSYISFVGIKTTETGSKTTKNEESIDVKYSCNIDLPNLDEFTKTFL